MNTNFIDAQIDAISIHWIGNKAGNEGVIISKKNIRIQNELSNLMTHYFVSGFKQQEFHQLFHNTDLKYNEVFGFISDIFDKPNIIHEQSVSLAKHLYEQSTHPKIKGGEFYVVYFKDCIIDSEIVDAVGLFKSENKDTFLKVYPSGDGFEIESQQGVNINKLDKGALIFNTDKENGYIVAIVDNTNKGAEAHYWIDDFLHVRQRKDEYYNTQNVMAFAKNFVVKELPKVFDVSKADQAELLNKTTQFFKEKETFDMEEFANEVITQPEVIDRFNQYKDSYAKERDIEFSDSFSISDTAVKKQARAFKSVIKLDKNFHIYIHGDRQLIEQGEDNKGKFYKVYYKEEQ
ncbi:nucleoid-associated protein [Bacteroides fragilis]|uniref:nucleoid-associated protein n=1 Tax=Bacteroides fragilis TaxID=817 RepID=UPI0004D3D9CD|nr:nucleoid-associated protein [Bacteroides fragilis]MCE8573907.1 nucleoid-associated protein [Bacteroides fragilis]QCQ32557.1 nucleoid-associated protein [Bacteroides fragilis]UHZ81229.1 nucleoid-associated protein [Bacteroides fragilis]